MIGTSETWYAYCDMPGCSQKVEMPSKYSLEVAMGMSGWKNNLKEGTCFCYIHVLAEEGIQLENSEEVVHNVHREEVCAGRACSIHRMTDHHMRSWPQHWRSDRQFMERMCSHGVGHPDPDQRAYLVEKFGKKNAKAEFIHGCDGCCARTQEREEQLMFGETE